MGLFQSAAGRLSKTGRNLKKAQFKQAKRQVRHQIQSAQEEIAFREKEDPREQIQLKQGMFARGMGKSSVHDDERTRLTDIQARRKAVNYRQLELAEKGLSLLKKQQRANKRMSWAASVDDLLSVAGAAASVAAL